MGRGMKFSVLCEDRRHENFIRYFLRACGVNTKGDDFYVIPYKPGQGAADQRVILNFPKEVKAFRSKRYRLTKRGELHRIALIVVLDADLHAVDKRLKQLNQELKNGGHDPINDDDNILIVIPKRHIETWMAYLRDGTDKQGKPINESDDYKHQVGDDSWKASIEKLAEQRSSPDAIGDDAPESLKLAWQRLQQFLEKL